MRLAFISDVHFGQDQNIPAYRFAIQAIGQLNVDEVFFGGDIWDHVALSSYRKEPEKALMLQQELSTGIRELGFAVDSLPGRKFYFLPGNHEVRLVSYLYTQAGALAGLDVLGYESLYKLKELGIQYCPVGKPVKKGHLWLAHGHEFPTGGPCAAHKALNAVRSNVLFGHVHKPSIATGQDLSGKRIVAYSNPCLSTLSPGYTLRPDWANGFSVVDFTDKGYFRVEQYLFWKENHRYATIVNGSKIVGIHKV